MKTICMAAMLLSSSTLFAQRFDITAFAGGTWSTMTKNAYEADNVGKINMLGAAELRYHPLRRLSIGIGVSAEKLTTGVKLYETSYQLPEPPQMSTFTVNIGKPVLTAYLIAGIKLPLGKYTLSPEITGGYVITQKVAATETYHLNYGNGKGSMLGMQVSVSRPVAKIFSLGLRAGIRYFNIDHGQGFPGRSKTISVPLGIQASVKI